MSFILDGHVFGYVNSLKISFKFMVYNTNAGFIHIAGHLPFPFLLKASSMHAISIYMYYVHYKIL